MTIIARYEKCPKCHKMFSVNPAAGRFRCPYCLGMDPVETRGKVDRLKNKMKKYASRDNEKHD